MRGRRWLGALVVGFALIGLVPVPLADAQAALVDINRASLAELKALPGMGEAYAQRIIAGRPYRSKNQLTQRGVLPEEEYRKIRGLIVAHRMSN